jgi:hypothetical protein
MYSSRFIMVALAGTALAATPAAAGGLLGGGTTGCLCNAVGGVLRGAPSGSPSAGNVPSTHRSVGAAASGSVSKSLNITLTRSIDRHNGSIGMGAGLAGTVNSVAGATVRANGVTRTIGLAGSASSHNQAALSVQGIGTNHARSLAGTVKTTTRDVLGKVHGGGNGNGVPMAGRVTGLANVSVLNSSGTTRRALANVSVANGTGGAAGKLANVSVLNRTGTAGRSAVNVAALNGTGGNAGKVVNVSVLNKTGTSGRSLANVAVLNGSGGTAGKLANVSILNRTGTTGQSLVNAAVLNGSTGGAGRVANISVLNGRHGNGTGNGNGGLGLPAGVQIINGIPCGPDGTPLTGAAAVTVMAIITHKGGGGHGGGGTGSPGGGSNSGGNPGGGSQPGAQPPASSPPPQSAPPAASPPPQSPPPAASKPGKARSPGNYPFEDRRNRDKN